ncbi:hypothetical protein EDC04DRAFT_2673501 [Pisolithus marmoratus]|nr:hypothetical protein EDC04DRAFT_2673501 [Pisolithus marmoratus]
MTCEFVLSTQCFLFVLVLQPPKLQLGSQRKPVHSFLLTDDINHISESSAYFRASSALYSLFTSPHSAYVCERTFTGFLSKMNSNRQCVHL